MSFQHLRVERDGPVLGQIRGARGTLARHQEIADVDVPARRAQLALRAVEMNVVARPEEVGDAERKATIALDEGGDVTDRQPIPPGRLRFTVTRVPDRLSVIAVAVWSLRFDARNTPIQLVDSFL